MAIFNSYVKLPEGIPFIHHGFTMLNPLPNLPLCHAMPELGTGVVRRVGHSHFPPTGPGGPPKAKKNCHGRVINI